MKDITNLNKKNQGAKMKKKTKLIKPVLSSILPENEPENNIRFYVGNESEPVMEFTKKGAIVYGKYIEDGGEIYKEIKKFLEKHNMENNE